MCLCLFSSRVLLPCGSVRPAALTITGSTISRVDSNPPPHAVDLGNRLITPAFINAHTHLPMAALRGIEGAEGLEASRRGDVVSQLYFKLEQHMSAGDVRAFCRMGAFESLLGGVGLVWEHYYHGLSIAEALQETGLAGVVAPTLQDMAGPGVPLLERAIGETAAIAADASLRESGIFAALGPHATDTVSAPLWRRIVATAAELGGLPVHTHLAQSAEEVRAVSRANNGLSPLGLLHHTGMLGSQLPLMLVHGNYLSGADLDLLGEPNQVLCHCPRSHALFAFPAPVLEWERRGLPFAVGTDAAASNDDMCVQRELRALATQPAFETTYSLQMQRLLASTESDAAARVSDVHARRVAAYDAAAARSLRDPKRLLATTWRVPGGLHPSFHAGVLQAGALANLLVWDEGHPNLWPAQEAHHSLVMADATPAIHGMVVAGKWVGRPLSNNQRADDVMSFQQSILLSSRYARAREDASARLQQLLQRAGLQSAS